MSENAKAKMNLLIHESNDPVNALDFNAKIAELAYYKSASRDFEPGHELDDWLEAERELLYAEK